MGINLSFLLKLRRSSKPRAASVQLQRFKEAVRERRRALGDASTALNCEWLLRREIRKTSWKKWIFIHRLNAAVALRPT